VAAGADTFDCVMPSRVARNGAILSRDGRYNVVTAANRRAFEPRVEFRGTPGEALRALLYDPQTSGGLLLLVPADTVDALLADLPSARRVGQALPPGPKPLIVRA